MEEKSENLVKCLIQVIELLRNSDDSDWTRWTVEELCSDLNNAIINIKAKKKYDREHLSMLLGPTGPIQETSEDNGWGYDYIKLAGELDKLN